MHVRQGNKVHFWVFKIKGTRFSDLGVQNQGNVVQWFGWSQSRKRGSVIWVFTIKETRFSDSVFTVKKTRFSDLGVHNQGDTVQWLGVHNQGNPVQWLGVYGHENSSVIGCSQSRKRNNPIGTHLTTHQWLYCICCHCVLLYSTVLRALHWVVVVQLLCSYRHTAPFDCLLLLHETVLHHHSVKFATCRS